jgi:hypothetical protein
LKPVPSYDKSNFITLRSHMLERQIITNKNIDKLTIQILKADGEEIIFKDTNILQENLDLNETIYVKCLYPSKPTYFYPNIYISSLKHNKKKRELSFKMYNFDSNKHLDNKIGSYRQVDKNKEIIPVNKYFGNNNLFLIDNKFYPVVKVTNDTITVGKCDVNPKKLTKLGFVTKNEKGYISDNIDDVNYKGGVRYENINFDTLKYDINSYYFIKKKNQVSLMFRLLLNSY